jgi:lysozyme
MRTFNNYLNEGFGKKLLTLAATGLALSRSPKINATQEDTPTTISQTTTQSDEITTNLLTLVRNFEGFRSRAHRDPGGTLSIGYGFTRDDIPDLNENSTITRQRADQLLRDILLNQYMPYVDELVTVPLNQNQRDALTSFIYNVGPGSFRRSTLLRELNRGNYDNAADEFLRWNRAGGRVLPGLTRRRNAERDLFRR